ncbi:hypothetical protein GGR56DRAFT_649461 [Xylariaceae sp. FL0804]|nr:hypothetical protein GGR56DRAFT_649461 [Xylariaceae sp. FL0804]
MCFTSSDRANDDDPAPRPAPAPASAPAPTSAPAPAPASQQSPTPSSKLLPPRRAAADMPDDYYTPPPGPPPSQRRAAPDSDEYAPPPGPPPPKNNSSNNPFLQNSGPSGGRDDNYDYAQPPPGPPPSHAAGGGVGSGSSKQQQQQKQQHDWEAAVPDTALLPPPPSFFSGFDRSPAHNATEADAEAGERWCRQYPLLPPLRPGDESGNSTGNNGGNGGNGGGVRQLAAQLAAGDVGLFAPPGWRGSLRRAGGVPRGVWRVQTPPGTPDTCLASFPPLYSAAAHGPLATGAARVAYFEVRVLEGSPEGEVPLAIGFAAPPYPPFRLPGWHRASVGVHGDDGHRYVNDRWGGKSFTTPFRPGETIGLGMRLRPEDGRGGGGIGVEVFLTRDGAEAGRWDLHEESDREQDLPVTGLEGFHDLCAAVGVFDRVVLDVVFDPARWMWRGSRG